MASALRTAETGLAWVARKLRIRSARRELVGSSGMALPSNVIRISYMRLLLPVFHCPRNRPKGPMVLTENESHDHAAQR